MGRRALIGAVVLIALIVGVTMLRKDQRPAPLPDPRKRGGEVSVAYPHSPASLNPYSYAGETIATHDILKPAMPTLLTIGPDLTYEGMLATKVPSGEAIGEAPFSVTFSLAPEAVWSDSDPLGADDVRFTWELIRNGDLAVADRGPYERVTDVEVLDEHTVKLVFDGPYPAWRDLFSAGDFILPSHLEPFPEMFAGLTDGSSVFAGPYVVEDWVPGLEISYVKNDRWWGNEPYLDRITVSFVPDIETALQLFESGRVDVVASTTEPSLQKRFSRLGAEQQSSFGAAWWELVFNHSARGPAQASWREAVARTIDRAGIVEGLVRSEGRELNKLGPGRNSPESFLQYRLDRELAEEALDEAARKPRATIAGPAESEIVGLVERAIQAGLSSVGITALAKNPSESDLYSSFLFEGDFDLALIERRGTPSGAFASYYSSNREPPGGLNYSRLADGAVDAAIFDVEHAPEFSPELAGLMDRLAEALPALPIFEAKAYLGYRSELIGPVPNATIDGPFWNLGEWGMAR